MPLAIGDIVRLIALPNNPCNALKPKYVNKLKGIVISNSDKDELGNVVYTVMFWGLGVVYVTDNLVEVLERAPKRNKP